MSYCLYLRKSRADLEAEAHGELETLARHERMLLELAKARNYDITQIYREVVSGETIAARPVMQHLLQEVEQGLWQGVLVVEVERLARGDTIDQGIMAQAFKYSGTLIITPVKTYDPNNEFDEEYFEFGLFMSRREYKTINRRLQRGRVAAAKEGKYCGSHAPYGYEKIKLQHDNGWTLHPVENEAAAVRYIFQLYTSGKESADGSCRPLGTGAISRELDRLNIPAPRNYQYWSPTMIARILQNPVYIGKIRWNNMHTQKVIEDGTMKRRLEKSSPENIILVDGLHPPIVDEATFNKAQDIFASHGAVPSDQRKELKNPFAGILHCGKCGRAMIYKPLPSGDGASLYCRNPHCDNISSRFDIVEARFLESLKSWVDGYNLEWETSPLDESESIAMKRAAIEKAHSELATLDKQLARTHDLLEQGIYSTDVFLARSQSISERIAEAHKSIDTLTASLAKDEERAASRVNIIPKTQHLLDVYASLPDAQSKHDLLIEIIERIEYTKEHKRDLENFELVIYPRIPHS